MSQRNFFNSVEPFETKLKVSIRYQIGNDCGLEYHYDVYNKAGLLRAIKVMHEKKINFISIDKLRILGTVITMTGHIGNETVNQRFLSLSDLLEYAHTAPFFKATYVNYALNFRKI